MTVEVAPGVSEILVAHHDDDPMVGYCFLAFWL